ncbi:flagellar biosynthesis protein FlhB [Pelotomaculum propionicicum]|uniref:Flagellar biosynthetic protein FlhB n=1 Tax=Pelotomaculum propionicicum TaxID=258475 RepID=A0A4Y7RQ59_9FIRM|nr:flagellar biosynthesis protein FlhB [Pelotomaculum propionicicum]NLI11593.1 flagellar biosynthesis protein FlhB [Peptococcaceae bacterium]TEB11144.1 Flagellar biosynthetic protein FlhB [Pelotomaculum propionicicum]
MAGPGQEKTEQATPRRIQEARRKGQVAKSADLTGALMLFAMIALLSVTKDQFFLDLQRYLTGYFSEIAHEQVLGSSPVPILQSAALFTLKLLAPFFVVALLVVLASNFVQVGFLFSTEALKPRMELLNPMSGLQRMFSRRSLVELVKSVLKFTIIGWITYYLIKANIGDLLLVFNLTPEGIYGSVLGFIIKVAWWGALAYLVLAFLDYMYQRYDYNKSMMMSKQEVKEEYRQTEGDPLVKAKQREMRRSISLNQIITEVPQATVVITNPTRLAVALKYRQGEMSAPVVVAKGAGWLAAQIREIAGKNNVPVVEDKEVARFLYQSVEPGQEIPLEIYRAVAQILAMVYRLKDRENYRAV